MAPANRSPENPVRFNTLIGALLSVALTIWIELWRSKVRRKLYGIWISTMQPVYYDDRDKKDSWHKQEIKLSGSLFG